MPRCLPILLAAVLMWGAHAGLATAATGERTATQAASSCLRAGQTDPPEKLEDWHVCLKASKLSSAVGRRVIFTADTNGAIAGAGRRIVIVDLTTRDTIAICFKHPCVVGHAENKPGVHKYTAVVSGFKGVPSAKRPRARSIHVLWLALDLELSAYANDRGPDHPHPALLCDPDGCGSHSVGHGVVVWFRVKSSSPIPKGLELILERKLSVGREVLWRGRGPGLAECARGTGCRVSGYRADHDSSSTFLASVYLDEDHGLPPPRNRVLSSNNIEMTWRDWTPAVTIVTGERTCTGYGGGCVYRDSTLTATVQQPLDPGVVIILYLAKDCVPQPGDPAGDPGCSAYSPKDCSPPNRICTYTGAIAAGYNPGALVVFNGPRPMLTYGSAFLPALP